MSKKRVVVTGIGTINAVGHNVKETWQNLLDGKSGIARITHFDTEDFASKIGAEVKNFDATNYLTKKEIKKIDLYAIYAIIAASEAIADSGFTKDENYDPYKAGCITGAGIGGMLAFEDEVRKLVAKGPKRVSPHFIPKMICNIGAAHIAIKNNLKGINFNCSSACASANHAIGTSFRAIQYGDADIIVTGGSEASVTPLAVAGFANMKALSTRNDDPQKASRPFDKERDGFVVGEGAGILVLEEYEHAKNRGAKIYAELVGYAATDDSYHVTAPAPDGNAGIVAIQNALSDANIGIKDIDYINAHGTSTPPNDRTETLIIRKVFGEYADSINVNSTKSMTGHCLGGAAAIEAIVCCKSIETGEIHPTINLENPDPDCDLNYTPNTKIKRNVKFALSTSLGFGGHNATIIFKKI